MLELGGAIFEAYAAECRVRSVKQRGRGQLEFRRGLRLAMRRTPPEASDDETPIVATVLLARTVGWLG